MRSDYNSTRMKRRRSISVCGFLAAVLGILPSARADIVERAFPETQGGEILSGYVLQGSHNMRRLGKSRSVRSVTVPSIVLPDAERVTVLPALQTGPLKAKPRFGYGSDYRPDDSVSGSTTDDTMSSTPLYLKPAYSPGTYYVPRYYSPGYYWGSPYSYFRPGCGSRYFHGSGISIFGGTGSVRFYLGL